MPLPRRALIAVTSAKADLFEGGGHQTGVFIGEAEHPFNVFTKAGFEVDLASETGEWVADWLSLQPGFLTEEERKQYDDKGSEFRKKLDNLNKAADLDGSNYGIFFASAGHAALKDYPHAKGLKRLAMTVWDNGGVVSTVCHGPAIFPGINDGKTGESIIKGKTITGFTSEAEDDMKVTDVLRSWGEPFIEEHAKALGATYVRPKGVWDGFHITDGQVVTGTNPASARETAEAALKVFETL
ncbi:class I glutamine amidotransferase-like protein [Lindgomyces ingoldianus]|uniref:Class I glutamine amidotransferase-like protein n=1 Tax=Lindgomyces ingoldianus TaxID=673940 RepID=A0ACB6R7D5_9PLEO|nr:class I glutamine amidotransferase-like protein [Lindgomyces ingoldianus]KAF2475096.1 class I glutamine amidotransferase-like protein [Lindgomyces ingoldianus]